MAVPKRKTSKARRNSRRAGNNNLTVPGIVICPKCGAAKLAHRACAKCGYYKNREAIKIEVED